MRMPRGVPGAAAPGPCAAPGVTDAPPAAPAPAPAPAPPAAPAPDRDRDSGGRLKFFKDGKFILELVRGITKEGERTGWVSVPRKTFWPPPAAPQPGTPPGTHGHNARTERATSLSVSDDNSSVQSSPWQRDHCWKQTTPRKNISKELTLYYCRPSNLLNATIHIASKRKRRRPYDTSHLESFSNGTRKNLSNGVSNEKNKNGNADSAEGKCLRSEDTVDGKKDDLLTGNCSKSKSDDVERWMDRERYYHMKLKKPYQYHKLRVYKKCKPSSKRKALMKIVDKLREKMIALPVPVNAKIANCRQEHMMVSPRKRILREMERVSLEDQGMKRRAKTVPTLSTASYPPAAGPSHVASRPPAEATPTQRAHNGGSATGRREPAKHSNYSIQSLLSMPDESLSRRSPDTKHSYTPSSLNTESPSSINSPDLSPSPDNYRYRYSLALGSPGQAGAPPRDSPTPPSELASRFRPTYHPQTTPPYSTSPYSRASRASPQYYSSLSGSSQYRGSPLRESPAPPPEWREGVPYMYPPYAAPYLPPHLYRTPPPPPLWMHYAMSPGIPPGPWAPMAHPLITDHIPRDEPSSDLPLNLSKH